MCSFLKIMIINRHNYFFFNYLHFNFQSIITSNFLSKTRKTNQMGKGSDDSIRYSLTLIPIFILVVIIYGLGLSILSDTITSASIASSQFDDGGASLRGIYIGLIVLGAFHLFSLICLFFIGISVVENWNIFIFILSILNILFNLISDALFYKFASCFNFPSNAIVVARSSLVIVLMVFLIGLASVTFIDNCILKRDVDSSCKKSTITLLISLFLVVPSIVILVLNAVLISKLNPQLNYYIQPSTIKMGFFNTAEISQIQSGTYTKTSTYDQQLIGNLGDIIFSSNKAFAYQECTQDKNGKQSCTSYYVHKYLYQILCSSQGVAFYADCSSSYSLTIQVNYLDSGPYPSYNCYINTYANTTCASTCTQLLASYTLILIQNFNNKIETAWTGLSKCNRDPGFKLTYDSTINPCSNAIKLKGGFIFVFLIYGLPFFINK